MSMKKQFGISAIFATILLVTIVFIPAVSAATVNESYVINNIDFDKKQLTTYNQKLDNFETVTTNPTTFFNDVSDGRVTLKLLEQNFDLDLQEMHIISNDVKVIKGNGSNLSQMLLKSLLTREQLLVKQIVA
jgi:hypothetical protein